MTEDQLDRAAYAAVDLAATAAEVALILAEIPGGFDAVHAIEGAAGVRWWCAEFATAATVEFEDDWCNERRDYQLTLEQLVPLALGYLRALQPGQPSDAASVFAAVAPLLPPA